MITGFNHTSFTVRDVERTVAFWRDVLGFEAASVSVREGAFLERVTGIPGARLKIAHMYGHGHHMEFIQYLHPKSAPLETAPDRPGCAHIALEVQDIHRVYEALTAAGAKSQGDIAEVTSGPAKGSKAVYIRDPEGTIIELIEWGPEGEDRFGRPA